MRYGKAGGARTWPWPGRGLWLLLWGGCPCRGKFSAKNEGQEKESPPFVPQRGRLGAVHPPDEDGRDRVFLQPAEKNGDRGLECFSGSRSTRTAPQTGHSGRREQIPQINSEHDEEGGHEVPLIRSRTCSRPLCSIQIV